MRRAMAVAVGLALASGAGAPGEPASAKPRASKVVAKQKRAGKRLGVVRGGMRGGLAPAVRTRLPLPKAAPTTKPMPVSGPVPPTVGGAAPLPALVTPVTPAPTPGPAPTATPTPVALLPRAVAVRSREFSFTLSRPLVGAGHVGIEFNNSTAEDPHDLHLIRSDGTGAVRRLAEALPGEVIGADADLAPGAYKLYCSLLGHEELGMKAKLRVEAG